MPCIQKGRLRWRAPSSSTHTHCADSHIFNREKNMLNIDNSNSRDSHSFIHEGEAIPLDRFATHWVEKRCSYQSCSARLFERHNWDTGCDGHILDCCAVEAILRNIWIRKGLDMRNLMFANILFRYDLF